MLTVAVLCSPLVRGQDSFPLSTYPMFSRARDVRARVAHVIARHADGSGTPVPPRVLGTAEIMQASQIARNAAKDRGRAEDLCRRVAERIARDGDHHGVVAIEVRTDDFDAIAYWEGDRAPRRTRIHARCGVAGGDST